MPQPAFQPTVTLRVPDLSEARTFYETICGLTPIGDSDDRLALGTPDGTRPVVDLFEAPDAPPRGRDTAGLFHLAIRFPTRASLSEVLKRVSRDEYGLIGASDHAVSEGLYTNDPAGNGVELYADRPRSTWERDDSGDIHMTSERLDIDAPVDDERLSQTAERADIVPENGRLALRDPDEIPLLYRS